MKINDMLPKAFLDSDGFPWSVEGIKCRSIEDVYIPLYIKQSPLPVEVISELSTHPFWAHIETPLLLEFCRMVELLHGIKKTSENCLNCSHSVCENCFPCKYGSIRSVRTK